ncbi:MAG: siderophore-interacting protein [Nocardioidaceae bacterium]|nr:siderophore-interacting protein [Nocardioidaceae bacterium]
MVFLDPSVPRPLPRDERGRVVVDGLSDVPVRMRSYTVRSFDETTRELVLDFVVHGDAGLAGPWAAAAGPGDEALLLGPGGGYAPDPSASYHLLAGDLSALPAIAVALERLPESAVGAAYVEVPGPADEVPLDAPAGVPVTWLHTGDRRPGDRLVSAVLDLPWPGGDVQAFVHGEAGAVREMRRHLRIGHGMTLDRLSVSGYWRLGVDDEGWRAGKREWNAAVEQDEAVAGVR